MLILREVWEKMEQKAYAKINIVLDVVGKKRGWLSFIKMIMQTIDLYDTIKIKK